MAKLETVLFEYLSTHEEVSAIADDRVYPIHLPEGCDFPAVVYQRISSQRIYTHDAFGTSGAYVRARIQFTCWSSQSALEAIDLGEAVLHALSGYSGSMEGELIGSSMAQFEMDEFFPEAKLFRRLIDFFITYEDDTASVS